MCKKDNSLCFTLGILAGVVGGCVAAVLYAPKSGAKTRKQLSKNIEELKEKVSPEVRQAKDSAIQMIEMTKCKIEQKYKKINDDHKAIKLAKAKEKENNIYCL